jgi:hypothetical protein
MSRSFLNLAVLAVIALGLAGCSKVETYRYKLTLAVSTPDGIKRGSSVVEVVFRQVWFPQGGPCPSCAAKPFIWISVPAHDADRLVDA